MAANRLPTEHHMGRRSAENDYSLPGMYHITLRVADGMGCPFGRVAGDANQPDGSAEAPHVELTAVGRMVEHELLNSIRAHYPMVEIQDYVVMPEHMHFIVEVHSPIVSRQGRKAHLGQVIAGYKKGCNRRFWAITGQEAPADSSREDADSSRRGKPAATDNSSANNGSANSSSNGSSGANGSGSNSGAVMRSAVYPLGYKVPSNGSTGRPPLFAEGYVDVMPLRSGQLYQQRAYIKNNPRSRLLRSTHRSLLQPQRSGIDTALTVKALMGYLTRECPPSQFTAEERGNIEQWLLTRPGMTGAADGPWVDCHSYGDRLLLSRHLLPVVCHRREAWRFALQRERCLQAAQQGAVLVSACIAKGEHDIMDEAKAQGFPVIEMLDNGMPSIYHPSAERMERCLAGQLLLVTPWQYHYRGKSCSISVAECKAMNCVVQALCRIADNWWSSQ